MKNLTFLTLASLLAFSVAQGQILIDVYNATPNGTGSGGTGTGLGSIFTSLGSMVSDRGMPVTTYSVTAVDLTSVGGTANEDFQFTVSYSQTGGTGVQFNSFGNVSVTGGSNDNIDTTETLTAKIALTSTTFEGLTLSGYKSVRVGGWGTGDAGTVSYSGGSKNAGNFEIFIPDGIDEITLGVTSGGYNFQRFDAKFVAVPEPAAFVLLAGVGTLGLVLYRRRSH